ncbi:universal stress protein [Mycobacterium talmoniae]|uniref:Universal stress protein n=1 Tax=Mycobacterium talmoniae TaxID=1858794 RepID=A0A1S1NKN4_9MYCO|nr:MULTISPECIES: universal stress protein [Mycobacterium]OHV03744.1 universal stress protein [Mycobacterium talmoniae]PQM49139.1 Universal stress protein [Mycobacterium talmoniae]TDH50574.1 universal stress protein [Mycobacterium eburneum]
MSAPVTHHGILVGVDGSPSSAAAVDWAARDAAMRGASLALVHILAPPVVMTFPETPMPPGYAEWQEEQGQRHIRDALELVRGRTGPAGPLQVSGETMIGSTVPTLVELSTQATMIVVGCRGHGRLRRSLLGSVSSSLVRHAHCPVAVIHDWEDPLAPDPGQAPVVVGIDGSPVSEAATALAFEEASFRGVELVAVYAWHDVSVFEFPGADVAAMQADGELVLAERLAGWQERYPDVSVRRVVACDRPADQLIEQSQSAQLVVVGSHGRGGFTGMLLGSVSTAVVQSARVPVIVARP